MLTIILPLLLLLTIPSLSPISWPLSAIGLMILTFLSFYYMYQPLLSYFLVNPLILLDQLSNCLITLTLWVTALMILASSRIFWLQTNPKYFLLLTETLALTLITSFSVSNLINFYIMFESSLVPTLLLILSWGYQPERMQAGMYLMLYTICASLPLLLSLMTLLYTNGHISIAIHYLTSPQINAPMSLMWWAMTLLALLVKMPLYIFHLWLPKAHVEAPIAGSMILAGLLLKLGGYGIMRLTLFYPYLTFGLNPMCNAVALTGAIITSCICLRQSDMKSLIAYSSISHMALVIVGLTLLTTWGIKGALAMMIAHGLCSSCLFTLANMTYEMTQTRSIFLIKGILCFSPALSFWWFIALACNMAAPPSINLFSEILLMMATIWASPAYMIPLGGCSFLAAAYSLYLFTSTNHGPVPKFFNPSSSVSTHFFSICLFHLTPLGLLILKPELITL